TAVPEQRPQQELAPVVREQQVVEEVGRIAPLALGARRDALPRRGLVVGRISDREDPVEPETDERRDVVGLRGLSKDRRAHRSISAASRNIQSISRSAPSRSSPSTPAGASSNTPAPASARARPIANSSSSAANVPGTGSPSMARWAMVRDVETPSAPASMPSR